MYFNFNKSIQLTDPIKKKYIQPEALPMDIIPIEYCDICEEYIHLNQNQLDCAFEHRCESGGIECPFKRFFSKIPLAESVTVHKQSDMPQFYFLDL